MRGYPIIIEVEIFRIDTTAKKTEKFKGYVAEEKPLYIFIKKIQYATIFCSPRDLKEMAVGHLLSEGVIKTVEEITEITFEEDGICHVNLKPTINLEARLGIAQRFSRIILSACGGPYRPQAIKQLKKIKSKITVKAETIQNCVINLNRIAETYRKTRGVHAAAIYEREGTLLAFAEDVGRHNAVDKVIGMCALKNMDFGQCFLVLSGRLTGDIVFKAARVGIPIIASIAAALDSGISIAKEANLTLIGFVSLKGMNVYTFPERILS
ncbi:MAG: formate dehydrogenase accessory sulfurtransferase FdhD [Candidatus Bathyarchaeia archaeon]